MLRHFAETAALLSLSLPGCGFAQEAGTQRPALPEYGIDLTQAVPLPGLPFTGAFSYPFVCSGSGIVYAGIMAFDREGGPVSRVPDLYSVSPGQVVKRIVRPLPTGFKQLDSPSFFAAEHTLVSLIRASQQNEQIQLKPHPGTDFFLSVSDPDGDHPDLIRLDFRFDPAKAAVFDSGEFLVVGLDRDSFQPVVALLNSDGRLEKFLDTLPNSGQAGPHADSDEMEMRRGRIRSIGAVQFAPWGSEILMVAPGFGDSSIYRIRASGEVVTVRIKLPERERLEGVLGSGGRDTWVVRTRSAESARKAHDALVLENPKESLYEIDPRSGEVLKKLDVAGPLPGEVACAADSKLTAIYVIEPPHPNEPERLATATARR